MNGEFYGEQRLLEFLPVATDGTAAAVVEEVVHDVLAFSGGRLFDDVAILAIKRVDRPSETPKQQKLEL